MEYGVLFWLSLVIVAAGPIFILGVKSLVRLFSSFFLLPFFFFSREERQNIEHVLYSAVWILFSTLQGVFESYRLLDISERCRLRTWNPSFLEPRSPALDRRGGGGGGRQYHSWCSFALGTRRDGWSGRLVGQCRCWIWVGSPGGPKSPLRRGLLINPNHPSNYQHNAECSILGSIYRG